MQRRQIAVGDLQFGMYVAELDRPWTETPFLFQGFHLRTGQQLLTLKKFCKFVFIDLERSERPDDTLVRNFSVRKEAAPEEKPPAAVPEATQFRIYGETAYPEGATVEEEFDQADLVYNETLETIRELLQPVAQPGGVLEEKQVKESVSRLTGSVVRNRDALMLVSRLRARSAEAHARALQVSIYLIVFARHLQLQRDELELLGLLGLLQDIGKTRLPPEVMSRKGPLTEEERELAKRHVEYSAEILATTTTLPAVLRELVLLHHERHDGSGYPRGLRGDQIGLYGSMAAIADTFDALTSPRSYAEPLPPSAALSYLYKERGKGYHPELVEQFIQCMGVFPVGSVVELNSGEVGIVITQNLVRRLKPRVMVVLDAEGNPMRPHKILDLDKEPMASSDEVYRIRRTMEQTRIEVDPRELFL